MTDPDPDEAPTRFGGESTPPPARSEDRTLPALDRQRGAKAGGTPKPPPAPRPAPPPPPPPAAMADPLIGKQIGGCRIDKLLGRGAMGAVYKARQTKLDRDVAVKVIRPEMMTDQRMLKRFEVEARTVGKFNSANVVMVHDVGFEHGVHYLVMEFVQGTNLRDHVKLLAGGRLPVGEALPLLRQSIKGLEEAQRLSVIHRDIKPDNLMITDRGVLKIADFGIAKPLQEDFSMTLTSELVGTPLYMSPEQCQGEAELDFRSDMYSLGATFYYLLTGEPPIRASSVYELIQTKTKLAHLCLWKALPGLEENNPLSRVIERMTALDRDDRYDSYEALLNDLVLVEQGQTITTPAGAGRKGRAAPGRSKWLAIGAVVLLAGGGGIWYATHQSTPSVILGDSPENRLKFLRGQLADPTTKLRSEIAGLEVPQELDADKQKLLGECDSGIALREALAAIPKPKKLALPFDDLREHFDAVAKAAKAHPVAGAEVSEWSERALRAARNEQLFAPMAREQLALAWADWAQRRAKAANMQARSALGPGLDTIEAARANLLVLLPGGEVGLKPTQDEIGEARRDLTTRNDVVAPVDVTQELKEVRDSLEKAGPSDDLKTKLEKLAPDGAQVAERDKLLNTVGDALRAKQEATIYKNQNRPDKPQLPFEDIAKYWDGLDEALRRARASDGKLPPWAVALRTEMRGEAELRDKAVSAMAVAWRDCQQRATAADGDQRLAALRAAKARAKELFGNEIAGPLEVAVPDKDLDAAANTIARVGMKARWQVDADKLGKQLTSLESVSDWSASAPAVLKGLAELQAAADKVGEDADVAHEQKRLSDVVERWQTAQKRMAEVDRAIGACKLRDANAPATAGAEGAEGKNEFRAAVDVVAACEKAFADLEKTLAIDSAKSGLTTAQERLRNIQCLPGTKKRIAAWLEALGRLEDASHGMVAIPSGTPKGGNTKIDAFFLDATECSRAEFAAFVDGVRAEVQAITGDKEKLDAVSSRFGGAAMTPERLHDLLQRDLRNDKLPIDSVSYHTATACAAWRHRALPTPDEWTLAAFGDGGTSEFAWGNGWATTDSSKRNTSNNKLVDVDAGGLSWRSSGAVKLHHLAGNVAEWLAVDANLREAPVAGSRFNDTEANAKERAGGKFEFVAKDDGARGVGFRTVLHVRSFPGLDWPK